ncbi:MAG TPA: type II toxin-antitoxin system RelE/ParE family toxin [Steroidobacteraceae bacterium]|nr:type II toxin-antitoxin system RelE/ParE family toxin [Steroidobacteraceae bacterium]
MNYEFHPEAEREFHEAALHYESSVPGLGRSFRDEISRVIELLLENPESGSMLAGGLRHFVLRRFPFSVVYAGAADLIFVIAIAHGSREPGYWQPRIQDR